MSAELSANRAGRMTIGQRFMLLRGVAALMFLSALGLFVSVAIGPNLGEAFQEDLILGVFATLFFLMCLAMGLGCAYGAATAMADAILGGVRWAVGDPNLRREAITTYAIARPLAIPFNYPGQYRYRLEVAGHEFTMTREAGDLLLRHRGRIRVYFSAHSGELLTIEPIAADPGQYGPPAAYGQGAESAER